MSLENVLARGRVAAEALMIDSCLIQRRGNAFTDSETGHVTYTYTTIYTGKCRVQRRTFFDRPKEMGENFVLMLAVEIQVPAAVNGVAAEDIVTITASVNDSDLVNRVVSIKGLSHKSHGTAKHLQAVEINS